MPVTVVPAPCRDTTEHRGHLCHSFDAQHALVNGSAGIVSRDENGVPFSGMGFMVHDDRILEVDGLADAERLRRLDLTRLGPAA